MKLKKILIVLTLTLALALSVVGCEDEADESETEELEEVTVDMFQFKVEVREELEEAAEVYMEENPHIELNIQTVGGGDDYGAALRSRFASGNEPAIFNVGGPEDIEDWFDNLASLSDEPWVDLAYDGVLDGAMVDGEVYGLPYNQEGYGFIYNKNIFSEAGINPDEIRSFADLEAAMEKLDNNKDELGLESVLSFPAQETWVTGLHLSNVAFGNEFDDVVDAYESEEVAFEHGDSFKKLVDLQAEYSHKPDGTKASLNAVDYSTQVEEMFSLGQVAMIQQGNWVIGSIEGIAEDLADEVGILPMPLEGVVEDSIPVGIPMYWAVNNNVDEEVQTAAKDFLNWIYTSETGKDYVINEFNFIPAFEGYEDLEPQDPLAKDILEYSDQGRTMPWVFMGYPYGWGQDIVGSNIQAYLSGDLTWDELVEDSQAEWKDSRTE